MSTRKIRVKRRQEDITEKLNLAAIRSEVSRRNHELEKTVDGLDKKVILLQETVSTLETALIDMANTCSLAATNKSSTRATVHELLNGFLNDLSTFLARTTQERSIRGAGVMSIGGIILGTTDRVRITLADDDEDDDPDEDIIANVSED